MCRSGICTSNVMTWYPTQSHDPDIEQTSFFVILLMPYAKLGRAKYQFCKPSIWLGLYLRRLNPEWKTRRDGRMSWASFSGFGGSLYLWVSNTGRTLVESNEWLKIWYLFLPSQVLDIIRIMQGTSWLSVRIMWLSGISGHGGGSRVSQVGQHYKDAMNVHNHKSVPS